MALTVMQNAVLSKFVQEMTLFKIEATGLKLDNDGFL